VFCTNLNPRELPRRDENATFHLREQQLNPKAVRTGLTSLHQIRSLACGAAALGCIQSRYTFVFFIDSRNRKSKNIIVL
jgi:hypothetical protein